MFTDQDFTVFDEPTLEGRLDLIRRVIDPKFETAGNQLAELLEEAGLPKLTLHVAKHLRRHKNPPPDTWLALSTSQRGYKMTPHLELGLWDDRLFLWLALLQEAKKVPVRVPFDSLRPQMVLLPTDMEIGADHTKKAVLPLTLSNFDRVSKRYLTTQAGEFLVGKTYLRADPLFAEPDELWADLQERVVRLAPVFKLLLDANPS
ncbi:MULTISPECIES: DUF1054 family protein [unclassified Lacticaseibacillus]|uniref:DUF1054 family protein n=1 Tax=unclassified Lacticaseibacillus TaxID=2759744 RepID=UPI001941CB40|nr:MULTISPECIES: DUF1054 family protein [unclassified Lacticaseibacillus]